MLRNHAFGARCYVLGKMRLMIGLVEILAGCCYDVGV